MKDSGGREYFLMYLPGREVATWATPQTFLYFYGLYKLVFLFDPLYIDIRDPKNLNYFGTMKASLGEEFLNIEKWDINIERRLFFRLSELGMIRGVASLYPEAEVNN